MNILKTNKKGVAISIVLYNASNSAIMRIKKIASEGHKIFIFDNSKFAILDFNSIENISYRHSEINGGLSAGIKFNVELASELGYLGVVNFDQDTFFTGRTIDFINEIFHLQYKKKKFGEKILSICFRDLAPSKDCDFHFIYNNRIFFQKIKFSINSGSLYFLEFYKKFNWFDSKFFVDGVDYNFCLNANLNGFQILNVFNTVDLNHQIEQNDNVISIFGLKIAGRVYGYERNKDFIKSHIILIYRCLLNFKFNYLVFILKSILLYFLTQILFISNKYINK